MKSFLQKAKFAAIFVAAIGAFGGASAASLVGLPVTIQEGAIAGAVANSFQANQLSGLYDEIVTFGAGNTFSTEAIFNATGWNMASQVHGFGANSYELYAKFIGSGTYSTVGGLTTFSSTSNALQLFADANQDTVYKTAAAAAAVPSFANLVLTSAAGSTADDVLLGSSSFTVAAAGKSGGSLANGDFEILFGNFNLAPAGLLYFTAPRPFYMGLDLNGNFQSITPVSGTSIAITASSANAFFGNVIPEPGSLALVGISMLGLGFVGKRRKL